MDQRTTRVNVIASFAFLSALLAGCGTNPKLDEQLALEQQNAEAAKLEIFLRASSRIVAGSSLSGPASQLLTPDSEDDSATTSRFSRTQSQLATLVQESERLLALTAPESIEKQMFPASPTAVTMESRLMSTEAPSFVLPAQLTTAALPASVAISPSVKPSENRALNWGYWIDSKGMQNKSVPRIERMKPMESYWFRMRLTIQDLSRFPGMGSIVTSPELTNTVEKAVGDDSRNELELVVLIHPSDDALVRIDASERRQTLNVNLATLRARPAAGLADTAKAMDPDDVSTIFGEFAFKFSLMTGGGQQVAISIIDAKSGFPLQNIVAELSTEKVWPASAAINVDNRANLRNTDVPFDLALYLYELNSTVNNVIHSSLLAQLRYADKTTQEIVYYQWKTNTSISKLKRAASTFKSESDDLIDADELLGKGFEFGQAIFDPPSIGDAPTLAKKRNKDTAALARRAIVAVSEYGDGARPPSMLFKLVNGTNIGKNLSSDLLPIGALGVSVDTVDKAVFLGERFALALLLTGQAPSNEAQCPKNWYVALPKQPVAKGALKEAYDGLQSTVKKWPDAFKEQTNSFTDLKKWFNPSEDDVQPHVFAFVGHHGTGRLFFEQNTGGINVGNMNRDFAGTSIAILNACNTAMEDIDDGTLVGHLAKSNVASVIATTSSISGHLAAAYLQCMNNVLDLKRPLTIGQAHALATQCLRNRGPAKPAVNGKDFSGNAMKYILVGNPHQAICAPEQKLVEN